MSARPKVTVVGAGNVGATCAQVLALRDYADVVLVDIKEGLPQGKALDINQMGAVLGYEPNVTGSNDYAPTAGSEVVGASEGAATLRAATGRGLAQEYSNLTRTFTSPCSVIFI